MDNFGTGKATRRREDRRFITGHGQYTDDIVLPRQAWLYFVRSPYAHGKLTALDVSAARRLPGVLAVYTGSDLLQAGVRDLPGAGMPDGEGSHKPLQQPPLARDRVRYAGEPLVAVVAQSAAAARDAAERVEFDVDELPAAVDPSTARGGHPVHDEVPDNCFGSAEYGDRAATETAFASAARTVAVEVANNRLAPAAMEPRACNASYDPDSGQMTVYQGCQGVHALRDRILRCVELDADKLRVICPDVGGAFGLKFFLQCETVIAVFASKALGRPVKWTADRSESFQADVHGRDHVSRAELALDENGRFLAMRATIAANIGAYCSQAGPVIPWFGACMTTGAYDIGQAHVDIHMVITNTVPVDAYRGAGRPEAAYLVERLVDRAAHETGIGRAELRRRNFIRPEQFPYTTAIGRSYDSGEYAAVMDAALERADRAGFAARRDASRVRGLLRGIGLACYVEICSAMGGEETHVRFLPDGGVAALVGTQSTGQGHETAFAQMLAARLGIDIDRVQIVQGDSRRIPTGRGTNGSRSMAIAGSSLYRAAANLVDAGRAMAAQLLQAAVIDIEFEAGSYRLTGTDRALPIAEVAAASYDDAMRPSAVAAGLASSAHFEPDGGTYPNGCHVCEVEIDPDTGVIDIRRYTVEDDVGTVINPLLLEGQIAGGVAQGLGQALTEQVLYEPDSGQLLSATFMDYAIPRADWMPAIDFRYREVPSPRNPLGVKGAGEAGTVGAPPALVSAVLDALAGRSIRHIDMPLTPQRVWQALHGGSRPG